MYQVGDEKTADGKTFIYTGYGVWQEKPMSTSQKSVQEQLLAELEKKADLTESQPVTIASIALPTGAATADKQDSQIALETTLNTLITAISSLIETNNTLSQRLEVLASMANSGQPALRTIPIASVSTAVSGSLTTVTNLTNFGTASPAKEVADDMNNLIVIMANINNVMVSP
jgi:hypothetical protein